MAADLHVGSVYLEQAAGDDAQPNILQFTFEGGAPGTQLTRIVIDGDKDGLGPSSGDVFFDTAPGGYGVFQSHPLKIVSHDGFEVRGTQVVDGGMRIVIDLAGFEVGETLVVSVDVDEFQFVSGGDIDINAVAEGAEFQRSKFLATFVHPQYEDLTTNALFWDAYNQNFAVAAATAGSTLDLPPDRYSQETDLSDLTAGAVAVAVQVPKPISLSGVVYVDANMNNQQDAGEAGLGGVTLELKKLQSGNYVSTGKTALTDGQGRYKFEKLLPGVYQVVETQPADYFSVGATPGKVNGVTRGSVLTSDILTGIELFGGDDSVRNDFAEALYNSISGFVGIDCENNENPPPIANVVIKLLDSSGKVIRTTQTDAEGNYLFNRLPSGVYTVVEEQPAGYFQGKTSVGTAGGRVDRLDEITQITLVSDMHGLHYDFCELLPVSIRGKVHVNTTGDCDNPANPPLAGVIIELLSSTGSVISTTTTGANGQYEFVNLAPGTYGIREIQPTGYFDGKTYQGSAGGQVSNNLVSGIVLISDQHATGYDFCEIPPAELCGYVYVDMNNNGVKDAAEQGIPGVTVELLDAAGQPTGVTVVTDTNGEYCFVGLRPGTYGVREIQPSGYFDGIDAPGDAGGQAQNPGDRITGAVLLPGAHAENYNFGELLPAGIRGRVHVNTTGDCDDPANPPLPGVTIELLGEAGVVVATTLTNSLGEYAFLNLAPGVYSVREIQPAGYFDGKTYQGTAGGLVNNNFVSQIVLGSGAAGLHYDFCEIPPVSIRGQVHVNTTGDCENPANPPLPGVNIYLLDAAGNVIATTTTNASGNYVFDNLRPGTYGVREVQPGGYFDGETSEGSAGGNVTSNLITEIVLAVGGTHAVGYDFCEIPPAQLSGYVFQDGPPIQLQNPGDIPDVPALRDGKLTPDDTRLAGVVLQLRDGVTGAVILGGSALPGVYAADQPITTVTDTAGYYQFIGLAPGSYSIYEIYPDGYLPGIVTAGSLGGFVISPYVVTDPDVLAALTFPPEDDGIVGINLPVAGNSVQNNFSVVLTTINPPFQLLPLQPPPPEPLVSPAFVGPPPPTLPLPELIPPFLYLPQLTRTAGALFTWHLSVVDAGQPRHLLDGRSVQLTAMRPESAQPWAGLDLSAGQWTLPDDADVPGGKGIRKLRFGVRGGTPIAGDFNGDGKFEIGVFKNGYWFIDLNDNGNWDEGDLWAKLGHRGDHPVTGDWDGDGKTDIGIYGPAWAGDPRAIHHEPGLPDPHNPHTNVHKNIPRPAGKTAIGERRMTLTATGKSRADLIDHVFLYGTPGDHPIVGDWNGDGTHTIAVFRDGVWRRDVDGDGKWSDRDETTGFGQAGDIPVVGDFDGDGVDEVGVYRNGKWLIDINGNGSVDAGDLVFELGGDGDLPIVGDWNGDGKTEAGVYHDAESPAPLGRAAG